jgi:hypothetical protein
MNNGATRADIFSGRSLIQNIPDVEFESVLQSHKAAKRKQGCCMYHTKLPSELTFSYSWMIRPRKGHSTILESHIVV